MSEGMFDMKWYEINNYCSLEGGNCYYKGYTVCREYNDNCPIATRQAMDELNYHGDMNYFPAWWFFDRTKIEM